MTKQLFLIIILFITPIGLHANAGSPMLWFSLLHLIVFNLIIGIFESWILKKMEINNKMGWIIVGNYVSMFVGMFIVAPNVTEVMGFEDFYGSQTSYGNYNLFGFLIGMFLAFVTSLLVEFPFYLEAIDKENRSKLFKGLIKANIYSYLIMILIYYLIVAPGGHY